MCWICISRRPIPIIKSFGQISKLKVLPAAKYPAFSQVVGYNPYLRGLSLRSFPRSLDDFHLHPMETNYPNPMNNPSLGSWNHVKSLFFIIFPYFSSFFREMSHDFSIYTGFLFRWIQEFYHLLVSLLDYCVGRLPASMVKPGPSGGSGFFRMAGVGGCFFELINGYKLWL